MIKKILFFGLICTANLSHTMMNDTALEPERNKTIAQAPNEEPVDLLERAPAEMWQLIANYLPGNSNFLSRLSRVIEFDASLYTRILISMFNNLGEIPLLDETDAFIDNNYKIVKKDSIAEKIRNEMLAILKNHPLRYLTPREVDIDSLDEILSLNLNPIWGITGKASISDAPDEITQFNIDALITYNFAVQILSSEELPMVEKTLQSAQINVNYLMRLIERATPPIERTESHFIKLNTVRYTVVTISVALSAVPLITLLRNKIRIPASSFITLAALSLFSLLNQRLGTIPLQVGNAQKIISLFSNLMKPQLSSIVLLVSLLSAGIDLRAHHITAGSLFLMCPFTTALRYVTQSYGLNTNSILALLINGTDALLMAVASFKEDDIANTDLRQLSVPDESYTAMALKYKKIKEDITQLRSIVHAKIKESEHD